MTALFAERLSAIEPSTVSWLWEPYLPRGKLTLLDGDPGVGKSMMAVDLAARLSRGAALPDGSPGTGPHVVLLLNAEDDPADMTHPRAAGAGADLDRLVHVAGRGGVPLRFPADVPALEAEVRRYHADLVVIDPMMAFFPPEVAANTDQCIRQGLAPLATLAEGTGAAVLLVRHLTKRGGAKAIYRGSGSIGILGSARTGLLIGPDPADPNTRVLAVTKSNLAAPASALGFRVNANAAGRSAVEWLGRYDRTADQLLARPDGPLKPRDYASDWLKKELAAGPRKAADVLAAAADDGIPEATLRRAKRDVDIRSHRAYADDASSTWYWYDPEAPWPDDCGIEKPFELPPLRGL
jgi:hypothetical protein